MEKYLSRTIDLAVEQLVHRAPGPGDKVGAVRRALIDEVAGQLGRTATWKAA